MVYNSNCTHLDINFNDWKKISIIVNNQYLCLNKK